MSWILDAIAAGAVLFFAYRSSKRGFVYALIEAAGFVLIFIAIHSFGKPVSGRIFDGFFADSVATKIEKVIESSGDEATEKIIEKLPEAIKNAAWIFGVDINRVLAGGKNTHVTAEAVTGKIVRPIAAEFIYTVLSVLLFGAGMLLARTVAKFANRVVNKTPAGCVNRMLGGAFGALKGIVIVCLLCYVITAIVSFTDNGFLIFTKENIADSHIFVKFAKFFSV